MKKLISTENFLCVNSRTCGKLNLCTFDNYALDETDIDSSAIDFINQPLMSKEMGIPFEPFTTGKRRVDNNRKKVTTSM